MLLLLTALCLYYKLSKWHFAGSIILYWVLASYQGLFSVSAYVVTAIYLLIFAWLFVRPLRMMVLNIFWPAICAKIPNISATEKAALHAGEPWWEKDIFMGRINWDKLHNIKPLALTKQEQAFLDNETETLCAMLDDWQINHVDHDLPETVWQYIKDAGFMGLVIDKKYGGLGFSDQAHSAIVMKVATRSITAAITVMVPNSLGPGELLFHYGTQAQKDHYLPRLAKGKDVPCFALTSPEAGSDAVSIPDYGVVCKDTFEGKEVLGVRMQVDKRYITLAPVATLVGLAFQLRDPEGLLPKGITPGITCVLLPHNHPGLEIGDRHQPLNLAFQNGTIKAKDMFVPLDWVIGGIEKVGFGWTMLVECLSIGRSISLPATATAGALMSALTTGAYAKIREQFGISIGKFEGIEEALAPIAGLSYSVNAMRELTLSALDNGIKPSIASAIAKYHSTEIGRKVVNYAMDIQAGKGVIAGPSNYLAAGYQSIPVGITVEGANILTRSLMIFGQGAMRAHPHLRDVFESLLHEDKAKAKLAFDKNIHRHLGYLLSNVVAGLWHRVTMGFTLKKGRSPFARSYRQIGRLSCAYAVVADVMCMILGGNLKRKERISARLGDVMSHLYIASSVLKYFVDHGERESEKPVAKWALEYHLFHAHQALVGALDQFPARLLASVLKALLVPSARGYKMPGDRHDHQVAALLQEQSPYRASLKKFCYFPDDPQDMTGVLECAFTARFEVDASLVKIRTAIKAQKLPKIFYWPDQIALAKKEKIITAKEAKDLEQYNQLREKVIAVDSFKKEVVAAGFKE